MTGIEFHLLNFHIIARMHIYAYVDHFGTLFRDLLQVALE